MLTKLLMDDESRKKKIEIKNGSSKDKEEQNITSRHVRTKVLECGELPQTKEISHSCALYCTRTIQVSAESNLLPKSSIFEAVRLFL